MSNKPFSQFLLLLGALVCASCATQSTKNNPQLESQIAQKIMLDIRYFCPELKADERCTKPVTELPDSLAKLIAETNVGGIVLFANNLENTRQIIQLNKDLQEAALRAGHKPLLIAVDQEGGRVVRIPKNLGTSFSGNMAIGATTEVNGTKYALQTGQVIAKELLALGFNVNFAPTVDVNVNPENPVINVRSFGEDADQVAKLGLAQMNAMQQQGIISSLKHFPGHGDTNVDSHTGLPRVEHDKQTIDKIDLKPFKYAIDNSAPGMIMTAHIQYPQLDNTEFTAKDGSTTILPATMSRKILTDLLRNAMNYQGVIITDALNMAGIAHFFDPTEAVIQTFHAGSDIALMPISVRSPADFSKVKQLIRDISDAAQNGRLDQQEIAESVQRINALKQQYAIDKLVSKDIDQATASADKILGNKEHRKIEQELANNAVVNIANNGVYPLAKSIRTIHLNMPDQTKCMAMTLALKSRNANWRISCTSLAGKLTDATQAEQLIRQADLVISADITPQQSMAEMGGMDDIQQWHQRADKKVQEATLLRLMRHAKTLDKPSIFISMRTPYNVPLYAPYSDAILATFAHNLSELEYIDDYGRLITQYQGPMFNAVADILTGKLEAVGTLPVSIQQ
ncbi:glycoside hydrolase family 3 protein [Neptunicella sp. SCSIO 80796]|uniref:glycoside hydrolase family 3 protein n=1 Tax=Neptunicella plasticusilytica TaxID=3117012 RepID=UPI003A4E3B8D